MERQREGDQTAARRRAPASGPRDQFTTRVSPSPSLPRDPSTAYGPHGSTPRGSLSGSASAPRGSGPGNSSTWRGATSPGATSHPRATQASDSVSTRGLPALSGPRPTRNSRPPSFSGPHDTLVPRATRQFEALDRGDGYDPYADPDRTLRYPSPSMSGASTALAPFNGGQGADRAPVIVSPSASRALSIKITPKRETGVKPWVRLTAGVIAIIACIVAVLGFQFIHPSTVGDKVTGLASNRPGVPAPSGRGPITAQIGAIVAIPAPQSQHNTQDTSSWQQPTYSGSLVVYGLSSIQPCHDSYMFPPNIQQWTVPPGCYGDIYQPNPANYPVRASWGWCNWWVEQTHPQDPNITGATSYPRGTTPVANAAIFIDGGEQGASSEGHWAEAVAVSPDGYWILISEMNFAWRGAGWGLIDYRYIHVSPHVHFLYGV